MKKIWGQAASAFVADKVEGFHSQEKPVFGRRLFFAQTAVMVTVMLLVTVMAAVTGKAQTSFYSPLVIGGTSGSTNFSNEAVSPDPKCPEIGGFVPNAPLWFSWTAPKSGEVELDTVGSLSSAGFPQNIPLNTVLAVFTGNNITGLSQVAANDDIFPINDGPELLKVNILTFGVLGTSIYSESAAYATAPGALPVNSHVLPYHGPSHLRFNAIAGQTYMIAVDSETGSPYFSWYNVFSLAQYDETSRGLVSLAWAYQSSGVFRFATEDFDQSTGVPLYEAAGTESTSPSGSGGDANSVVQTYYSYNAPGVLVTVTRVGGSAGRCLVDYSTVAGTALVPILNTNGIQQMPYYSTNNEAPGFELTDYEPATGTLVFDDYEMSKTILVPIVDNFSGNAYGKGPLYESSGGCSNNIVFGIRLSNPRLDDNEYGDVSQPRIDPTYGTAMIRILNPDADPYGPDVEQVTNIPMGSTNLVTIIAAPTNALYCFEKAHYRVPEDVTTTTNHGWTQVGIYVERFGTNNTADTLNYRINAEVGDDANGNEETDIRFPLDPGSDYAAPDTVNAGGISGPNSDFSMTGSYGYPQGGSISFPATGPGARYQEITFTVTNSTLTKFNKDFDIELYREAQYNGGGSVPWLGGMVAKTTVTILFNDQNPPAGSVDELYNADFNTLLALPPPMVPSTTPERDSTPGVSGIVSSVAVLTNNETLIAGDFVSYNGFLFYNNGYPINSIALIDTNGNLDQSFAPNSGADGSISSVAQTWDGRYIVGGNFVSFNGQQQAYVARINQDGSIDPTFNPSVNGSVQSVVVQPDNKVLIGGSFSQVNGQLLNCVARLNTDGTVDTGFNPGTVINGSVNALALLPGIYTNRISNGSTQADSVIWNVSPDAIGRATIKYTFPYTNELLLVYGNDVLYDSGVGTNGATNVSIPFGPGSTPLGIIVNPNNLPTGTNWSYIAYIQTNSDVAVGGSFTVNGEPYANVTRLTTNGLLDTTFSNIFAGADNTVYALGWQANGELVVGGAFANFNGIPSSCITRLNWDGSVDTVNFADGTGANDIVWNINVQPTGTMYVGGQFTEFNGTHRLGFTRLYSNGTVDTTFMDTAYDQFAGLKKIFADDFEAVYASGVQNDSNVIIGGEFNQVGGGEANTNVCNTLDQELGIMDSFGDGNLWVEPKTRDGVRNRSGVARLIGGSTPGPGNIQMQLSSYSANKNQTSLTVSLVRTNGTLGPVSANFSVQNGAAQSGVDYFYDSTAPQYWVESQYSTSASRERSDGLYGVSSLLQTVYGFFLTESDLPLENQSVITVSVINDTQKSGNQNAQFQLANPSGDNEFYLGGENIPLGSALGASSAPFTIIDNTSASGTFGFISTNYFATNNPATITVLRSNGIFGTVTMRCWATNGSAIAGTDFKGVTNFSLQFGPGPNLSSNAFSVNILANGLISTNFIQKTINLSLTTLSGGNAMFGISNATLTLVNPNFQGYLTLSATNYTGNEGAGSMSFIVKRVSGSAGQISVQYATTNGTATNGVNYIGATNSLSWGPGDSSSRVVNVPLIDTGMVGGTRNFGVNLFNPTNSGGLANSLFYVGTPGTITNSITSATMTISNSDSYGTLQFSSPSYLVNANGGYATLTVVRAAGATGNVSVNYATSNGSHTTAGVNYMPTNGVLTFAGNQIAASFNVFVSNGGTQYPSNFFFNVTLSNPTNAVLGSPANAVVNILSTQYNWSPGTTNGLFNANMNGSVLSLAQQTNGQILAGGDFTSVDGTPQDYIARLNADGSLDTAFDAGANGPVQAVVCQTDGNVILGGAYTTVDGLIRNNIARVLSNGFLDTSFNPGPGANGPIYALAEAFIGSARVIYVGGAFSTISSGVGNNTGASLALARLNNDGSLDTSFNIGSGADGTVYAIAVYPSTSPYAGDILIGGGFVHYNGVTVNGLARLTPTGLLDATFNPGSAATNGVVDTIAIQPDSRILVGGSFSTFNGLNAYNIVRLNTDGSTDNNFSATVGSGANNTVDDVVLQQDDRILVVGQFTQFNGLARNGVTRLLPTGANDLTINFGTGANGAVNTALIQPTNGIITLGGAFTAYNGVQYNHIVQIYGLSLVGSGAFQFNAGTYQVTETGIVAPITIIRTGGTSGTNADGSGNIFVNFSTVANGSTAVAGVNYSPISTNLTFTPGQTYQIVNIPIFNAVNVSTNSWFVDLGLSAPTPPAVLGSLYQSVLNIQNVNSAVNFQTAFTTVFENIPGGVANIGITREGATNGISTVDFYTTTNTGTGIPGTDYFPTNETITFNPGVSQALAQVLIISNSTLEKTVGMVLTNPVNTFLYSPSNATLTVIDNVSPPGELLFASANYTVNESSGMVAVTIIRTNGFSGTVSANYMTVDGSAQSGINYATNSGTVTFNDNVTAQTINIPILENNPPEGPVNFSVVLFNPTIATLIAPTNTTVTIVDDVNTGVSFLNVTNSFIETAGGIAVPVQRVGNTNNAFSVHFSTTNDTALAGVNYVTNSGTLNFGAGQTFGGISLNLINNEDVSNETFGVNLSSASAGVQVVSPSNAVVVVQPVGVGLTLATPTNSVLKSVGSILVPVVCLNPSAQPPVINNNPVLTVNYSTVNGTALAGEDYTAVSGTLVFTNGLVTTNIVVPILNNSLITGVRNFTVSLSNPQPVPPGELIAPSSDVITIIDSNSGLAFSSPNYSILNGGLATITVIRQDNTNTASTVNYATVGGGTAISGTDYYPTNGVLTFTNGQTSATFAVTVIGSSSVQPNKTILLQLSDPTPANTVLMAPNVATLTVYNNNGSFVVPASVSLVSSNVPPGGILQSNLLASLSFGFRDAGGTNVANLMATLLPVNGITSPQPTTAQSYGGLTVNGPSVSHVFNFIPIGTNGQTILATFKLQDNGNNLGTNTFALTIGSWTTTFSNTNTIIIPPGPAYLVAAIAAPYPSVITVSNVGGVLIGTSVTFTNFTHTSPQAVGALVVSPAQQDTLIMADVGTQNVGANHVTLTFSDTATNSLPSTTTVSTPITNGVYKPTQDGPLPNFP